MSTLTVGTISEKVVDAGVAVDGVTLKDGELGTTASPVAINSSSLNGGQFGGRRNILINSKMAIAQRGTSASSKTTNDYFTCDRWRTEASGATYNTSQQTNSASDMATTGAEHFLRMEVTTANNNSGISQKIEAQNIKQFKGKKLTLSFYAKGTNPNGGSFNVTRFFTDGSATSTAETSSLTVTSSWVKYTYTFDYPDEGSVNMTLNTAKMAISFLQPDGDASTNAWTLDLTSVQLEVGEQATPLEHLSYGETLSLCQRYYYRRTFPSTYLNYSIAYGTTDIQGTAFHPVQMRASPTLSFDGVLKASQGNSEIYSSSGFSFTSFSTNDSLGFYTSGSAFSGLTQFRGYMIATDTNDYMEVKSEL